MTEEDFVKRVEEITPMILDKLKELEIPEKDLGLFLTGCALIHAWNEKKTIEQIAVITNVVYSIKDEIPYPSLFEGLIMQ